MMIKRILICGFNDAALLAAVLLSRQLKGIEITLLQSETPSAPIVAESAGQNFFKFLDIAGIDHKDFFEKVDATFSLGKEYSNWSEKNRFFLSATPCGEKIASHDFHQVVTYLSRVTKNNIEYADFSVAAQAYAQAKLPGDLLNDQQVKISVQYDLNQFCAYLFGLIKNSNLHLVNELIGEVLLDKHGGVKSIKTTMNREFSADFYIDCTRDAKLLGEACGVPYVDLSQSLMINKSAFCVAPVKNVNNNAVSFNAVGSAIVRKVPFRQSEVYEVMYSSSHTSDEDVTHIMDQVVPGKKSAIAYHSMPLGYRSQVWKYNCLALGKSAANLGAIEYSYFYLTQSMLLRFIDYFPSLDNMHIMSMEYNRLTLNELFRIADYHMLNFWCLRKDHPLSLRNVTIKSATFNRKIHLFLTSGKIINFDFEIASESQWFDLLMLSGFYPANVTPLLDNFNLVDLHKAVDEVREKITMAVKAMPSVSESLARNPNF